MTGSIFVAGIILFWRQDTKIKVLPYEYIHLYERTLYIYLRTLPCYLAALTEAINFLAASVISAAVLPPPVGISGACGIGP